MKKSFRLSMIAAFMIAIVIALASANATQTQAQGPQPQSFIPLGTMFTDQGQLRQSGTPVNGDCVFQHGLWSADTGGDQLGIQTLTVTVQNGLFTVPLDFGDQFTGDARWLQTAVKCPGDSDFVPMSTRQPVDPVPYAMGLKPGVSIKSSQSLSVLKAALNATNSRGGPTIAIDGLSDANSGNTTGVQGRAQSPAGYGVVGKNTAGGYAGYFSSDAPQTVGGVIAGALTGVNGASNGIAILGLATAPTGNNTGVWGESNSSNGFGVVGQNTNGGYAGYFSSNTPRILGGILAGALKADNSADGGIAIYGLGGATNNTIGVYGRSDASNGIGVYGESGTGGGYAGYFNGNVFISGNLSKSGGSFKIDHPLDPENKYLYHSFVESPDMLNIYNGNITTDANGDATVILPDYFEVLNQDFRYQLTAIGQFAQAIVSSEIQNNRFHIKSDKPNVKVSWQVTGIRHDPYANQHRIQVEVDKPADERGKYLHPEVYGRPESRGVYHEMGYPLNTPVQEGER